VKLTKPNQQIKLNIDGIPEVEFNHANDNNEPVLRTSLSLDLVKQWTNFTGFQTFAQYSKIPLFQNSGFPFPLHALCYLLIIFLMGQGVEKPRRHF